MSESFSLIKRLFCSVQVQGMSKIMEAGPVAKSAAPSLKEDNMWKLNIGWKTGFPTLAVVGWRAEVF